MRYAYIKAKECINVVVFETKENVDEMKKLITPSICDDIIFCPDEFSIGDLYDKVWKHSNSNTEISIEERVKNQKNIIEQLRKQLETTQDALTQLLIG